MYQKKFNQKKSVPKICVRGNFEKKTLWPENFYLQNIWVQNFVSSLEIKASKRYWVINKDFLCPTEFRLRK